MKVNNLVRAYVQRYKYFRKRGRRGGGAPGEEALPGGGGAPGGGAGGVGVGVAGAGCPPPKDLGGPLEKGALPLPPL